MVNLVELIKKAALDAVVESKPSGIFFGTVTNISPLQINIEQRLPLNETMLILTSNVIDHYVDMTVEHTTESKTIEFTSSDTSHGHDILGYETEITEEHRHKIPLTTTSSSGFSFVGGNHEHDYVGRKKFFVHYGLKVDEKVILLRVQGGQKFIVLDRVR